MIPRSRFRLSILPAVSLAVALLAPSSVRAEVTGLDRAGLEALLAEGVPVVDVRREDERRERGVIEGSHALTFFDARGRHDVGAWLAELSGIVDPDEPLVLICASGVRSGRIADLLDGRLGFTAVHDVTGGIEGWRKSGGKVVPHTP